MLCFGNVQHCVHDCKILSLSPIFPCHCLVREILQEYPETFHTDIKENNYVCNILKSVPRGGEIDIVQRNDLEIRES